MIEAVPVKKARWAGLFVAIVIAYLLFWPSRIDPIAWTPSEVKPGRFQPTGDLSELRRMELHVDGPEDVEVDEEGRIFVGVGDGRILRMASLEAKPETIANTKGRPLGLHWGKDGRLLVADADRGLMAVDPESGALEVLTSTCGGTKLVFTDDLDVGEDGTVWFTDASVEFSQPEWNLDIVESRANGRFCAYDPRTKETREVIPNLHFANGVAVDPKQRFVLINETSRYRVQKYWLTGPKKGTTEVLIEGLPGFPDNISTGENGIFWIAVVNPRNAILDRFAEHPFLRKVIMRLPRFFQPAPVKTARAIGVDEEGKVLFDLFDPNGTKIWMVTAVQERNGRLFFGSLKDTAFATMPVPQN